MGLSILMMYVCVFSTVVHESPCYVAIEPTGSDL